MAPGPNVVWAETAPGPRPREQGQDVAVGESDALGLPRRAGDVQKTGQSVWPRRARGGVGVTVLGMDFLRDQEVGQVAAGQHGRGRLVGDYHPRARVGQHELRAGAGVFGVDRQVRAAGFEHRQQRHGQLG